MAKPIRMFVHKDIGNLAKRRNEDHAIHATIDKTTYKLHVAIICDGVSQSDRGIISAEMAAEEVIRYLGTDTAETNVAKLLFQAVKVANHKVYMMNDPLGEDKRGYTTIAITAVQENKDATFKLYIASVGDSPIFLARQDLKNPSRKQLIRLNIDHTNANEAIIFDGLTEEQAYQLPQPHALCRAIGYESDVEVDIGIYNQHPIDADAAFAQGAKGMPLQEGDTLIVCSDGLTSSSSPGGDPYVTEEDFLQYAYVDDIERAARALVDTAVSHRTHDNASVALTFLPGERIESLVRRRTGRFWAGILTLILVIILTIAVVAINLVSREEQEKENAQATSIAYQETLDARVALEQTHAAYPTITPYPSDTPSPTATATSPPTPTATATIRPSLITAFNPLGYWQASVNNTVVQKPIEADVLVPSDGQTSNFFAWLDNGTGVTRPANLYIRPQGTFIVDEINSNSAELIIQPNTDLFVQSGQFADEGMTIATSSKEVQFSSRGECVAANYQANDTLSLYCFDDQPEGCGYMLDFSGQRPQLQSGWRINIKLTLNNNTVMDSALITYNEALAYYELVTSFNHPSPDCLSALVDFDRDGVVDSDEGDASCREVPGKVEHEGCPDTDQDDIPDHKDRCVNAVGPASNNGCPLPPPDRDSDGVPNSKDPCPYVYGIPNGCPDTDGDGFSDDIDLCITLKGDNNGCPTQILDMDGDGFADSADSCPNQYGTNHGCPVGTSP